MLCQYVDCNFPTELRPLARIESHVRTGNCWRWLIDNPPASATHSVSPGGAAIAVGQEQRSSYSKGLSAQDSVKADVDHKELFPAVTNPATLGATAGVGVHSADPSSC
jgi:hypothetical protein